MGDEERLRAFEDMLAGVMRQHELEAAQMERLRAAGREKSATYKQYAGNRLVYNQLMALYRQYGIVE